MSMKWILLLENIINSEFSVLERFSMVYVILTYDHEDTSNTILNYYPEISAFFPFLVTNRYLFPDQHFTEVTWWKKIMVCLMLNLWEWGCEKSTMTSEGLNIFSTTSKNKGKWWTRGRTQTIIHLFYTDYTVWGGTEGSAVSFKRSCCHSPKAFQHVLLSRTSLKTYCNVWSVLMFIHFDQWWGRSRRMLCGESFVSKQ